MAKKKIESHEGVPIEPFVEEYLVKPTFDQDGVQVSSGITPDGKEHPDPVPMSPPVGYQPPLPLMDIIGLMVHREVHRDDNELEIQDSEAEAADFDIDDDPDPPLTDSEKADLEPAKPEDPPKPVITPAPAAGSPEPPAAAPVTPPAKEPTT